MRDQDDLGRIGQARERIATAFGRRPEMFEELRTGNEGVLMFTPEETMAMQENSARSLFTTADVFVRTSKDEAKTDEEVLAVANVVTELMNVYTYCYGIDTKDIVTRARFAEAMDYCIQEGISPTTWPFVPTPQRLIAFVEERTGNKLSGQDLKVQQGLLANEPNYARIRPPKDEKKAKLRTGTFDADSVSGAEDAVDKKEAKKPRRWGRILGGVAVVAALGIGMFAAFTGSSDDSSAPARRTTTTAEAPTATTTTSEIPTTTVAMTTTSGIPTTIVTVPAVAEASTTTTSTTTTAPASTLEQGSAQPENSIEGAQQAPSEPRESVDQKPVRGTTIAIPGALVLKKGENITNQLQDLITGSHGSDIDNMPNVNRAVGNILRVIAVENNRSVSSLDVVRAGVPIELDAFSQAILQQAQAAYRS